MRISHPISDQSSLQGEFSLLPAEWSPPCPGRAGRPPCRASCPASPPPSGGGSRWAWWDPGPQPGGGGWCPGPRWCPPRWSSPRRSVSGTESPAGPRTQRSSSGNYQNLHLCSLSETFHFFLPRMFPGPALERYLCLARCKCLKLPVSEAGELSSGSQPPQCWSGFYKLSCDQQPGLCTRISQICWWLFPHRPPLDWPVQVHGLRKRRNNQC